jgi:hypothetical protein
LFFVTFSSANFLVAQSFTAEGTKDNVQVRI